MLLGGFLIGDDVLIVPVKPDHRDGARSSIGAAYVFRFCDGVIVSLTEYRTVEDAVQGALSTTG